MWITSCPLPLTALPLSTTWRSPVSRVHCARERVKPRPIRKREWMHRCSTLVATRGRTHFRWEGTRVVGVTPTGRATVTALDMNRPLVQAIREEEMYRHRHPPPVDS